MRLVIQRVSRASVYCGQETVGSIGKGYVVLLGVAEADTKDMVLRYIDKLIKLRIFSDDSGKTNLSINDVNGEILVVSQFTLYADCKKGNRPSFLGAGSPERANELYEFFINTLRERFNHVQCGRFGEYMEIELVNDGPFTLVWDSDWW